MKTIILGSSGMVGKGVLLECLEEPDINEVLVINRRPTEIIHQKLKEIVHDNFFDYSSIKEQLKGYDACFFCLGVSSAGLSEEKYRKITYDLTLIFAQTFLSVNPHSIFCYVSGAGTDSTENGRMMWARVKGKTENDLFQLHFKAAYMFRPGYIQPLKGIRSRTAWYNLIYLVFKPFYFLLKPFRGFVTDTVSIGKAMIKVARSGYNKKIIESIDINNIVKSL